MSRGTERSRGNDVAHVYGGQESSRVRTGSRYTPPDFSDLSTPPRSLEEAKRLAVKYYPQYENLLWWFDKRFRAGAARMGIKNFESGELLGWLYERWVYLWTIYDPAKGAVTTHYNYCVRGFFNTAVFKLNGGYTPDGHSKTKHRSNDYFRILEKTEERSSKGTRTGKRRFATKDTEKPANQQDTQAEVRENDWSTDLLNSLGGPGALEAIVRGRLDARTATILLQSAEGMNLGDIGRGLGITKERTRQLRVRGAKQLRKHLLCRGMLHEPWLTDVVKRDDAVTFGYGHRSKPRTKNGLDR
jgi:hypothetical protein